MHELTVANSWKQTEKQNYLLTKQERRQFWNFK